MHMTKLIRRSLIYGFIAGTVFFAIAPLGLGIAVIEFLRPILIPGVSLFQLFRQNLTGIGTLILGLILNGIIYSLLFLSFSLAREYVTGRKAKLLTSVLVSLAFLTATGMLGKLVLLLTSADKSWIFQIGA